MENITFIIASKHFGIKITVSNDKVFLFVDVK